MGHPDRTKMREKKNQRLKEELLKKKNTYDVLDLTPYNALHQIAGGSDYIKYK